MAYAAFNIGTFIDNMTKDGARPNLFDITFAFLGDTFTLRAEASAIPGSSIGVATAPFFGRDAKFAGNRRFDNWTVTVLVDETDYAGGGPRFQIESWMNQMNSHVENKRLENAKPATYMKDAHIKHYGKIGDVIATYKMIKSFPIDLSPVSLGWNLNDQIERFTVTFAMQWWESTTGSTDISGQ